MRRYLLTASLLLVVPIAAGCARADASTPESRAAVLAVPAAVVGIAGNCAPDAGSMQPAATGASADVNGDGYVCSRSAVGETARVTVDNDAASDGRATVESNVYRGM
ncbi:MAG TPA: hypothetical protein VFZ21_08635 [Gemmatimonadaceae bacterium]|nr:hypothetical protein [Gemmatimonadaceae bacterium]